jgi:hypothetical protein
LCSPAPTFARAFGRSEKGSGQVPSFSSRGFGDSPPFPQASPVDEYWLVDLKQQLFWPGLGLAGALDWDWWHLWSVAWEPECVDGLA